jgi:hypothetical protein
MTAEDDICQTAAFDTKPKPNILLGDFLFYLTP